MDDGIPTTQYEAKVIIRDVAWKEWKILMPELNYWHFNFACLSHLSECDD
jgi:hypothetical protein